MRQPEHLRGLGRPRSAGRRDRSTTAANPGACGRDTVAAAAYLRLSARTLRRWRTEKPGTGRAVPPAIRVGPCSPSAIRKAFSTLLAALISSHPQHHLPALRLTQLPPIPPP